MKRFIVSGAVLACAVFAAQANIASAQPEEIAVDPDDTYVHEWTGASLPAEIFGMKRDVIVQYQERASNIGANYDNGRNTYLSVYIYRHGAGDASLWHDRARHMMVTRDQYAHFDPDKWDTTVFDPFGGTNPSAIMTIGEGNGGGFRSTGVVIFTAEDWMFKVRMSSASHSADELRMAMQNAILELAVSAPDRAEEAAYTMTDCGETLVFEPAEITRDRARVSELSVAAGIALITAADIERAVPIDRSIVYCREGRNRDTTTIYRPNESREAYLIAVQDAGVAIEVARIASLFPLDDGSDDSKPEYAAITSTSLEYRMDGPFQSLPDPQQAYDFGNSNPPFATVSRPLGDEGANVTITTDDSE